MESLGVVLVAVAAYLFGRMAGGIGWVGEKPSREQQWFMEE